MLNCDMIVETRARRSVSDEHVADLQRAMRAGVPISRDMLEALFLIDRYAERAGPAWMATLAQAVLKGLVAGEAPAGVMTEAKMDQLLDMMGSERIGSPRSLELIDRVMASCEGLFDRPIAAAA
jgi:hypothetical protein